MDNKIDPCDTMRVNLIAAAVGLQQCTKTESNIVPIPGGDRVIAIGTPAQVRALLGGEHNMPAPDVHEPSWQNGYSRGYSDGSGDERAVKVGVEADQIDSEGGHHD